MAEIWGAAIVVAGTLYSANQQKKAAAGAAGASQRAADAATAEQQREYDQTRADQQPWMQAGQNALTQMQALNSGDFSSFTNSPDYAYARDQMQQGIERGAAARGSLYSGGTNVDLGNALNGIASQNYGNYYNRLAGLSGTGQTTASGLGSLGANMAGNIGQIGINNANNQRQSIYDSTNANTNATNSLVGAFGQWYGGQNKSMNGGWYLGNQPGKG